jgi:carbamoyl-phosphate synthase large subunit
MIDLCRKYDVKMLLSLHDLEIAYLAPHRDAFLAIGAFPVIPDNAFARICLDKLSTVEFARHHNIKVPATFVSLEDAQRAVAEGMLEFPVMVKPRNGFGSIALHMAESMEELCAAWHLVHARIGRTPIAHSPEFEASRSVLIQQKLRGPEYGIDVVNDLKGRFVACLIERKLDMRAGETDSAVIEASEPLATLGRRIALASQHPGNLDLDVIVEDGTPYLLEMNPRFGGHYPFAHIAGANVPAALIAWARGEAVEPSWLTARIGCRAIKDFIMRIG